MCCCGSSWRAERPCESGPNGRQSFSARSGPSPRSRPNESASLGIWSSTCVDSTANIADVRARIVTAVDASNTTLTEVYGVGPIVAALILGHVGDPARFPTKERFASYNATAPVEASSGPRVRHRLNHRGNRQLNHAMHIIAVTQIAHDTPGRVYFERKLAEGKSRKEALRALEAQDQRRRLAAAPSRPRPPLIKRAREDNQGRLSHPAWPALHPDSRRFG